MSLRIWQFTFIKTLKYLHVTFPLLTIKVNIEWRSIITMWGKGESRQAESPELNP
jgi:hypothetical protein